MRYNSFAERNTSLLYIFSNFGNYFTLYILDDDNWHYKKHVDWTQLNPRILSIFIHYTDFPFNVYITADHDITYKVWEFNMNYLFTSLL